MPVGKRETWGPKSDLACGLYSTKEGLIRVGNGGFSRAPIQAL